MRVSQWVHSWCESRSKFQVPGGSRKTIFNLCPTAVTCGVVCNGHSVSVSNRLWDCVKAAWLWWPRQRSNNGSDRGSTQERRTHLPLPIPFLHPLLLPARALPVLPHPNSFHSTAYPRSFSRPHAPPTSLLPVRLGAFFSQLLPLPLRHSFFPLSLLMLPALPPSSHPRTPNPSTPGLEIRARCKVWIPPKARCGIRAAAVLLPDFC